MKNLILILTMLLFSCVSEIDNTCNEQCRRLMSNDYDPEIYSNSEIVSVYKMGGYEFSHSWTKLEHQMYLDSIACGFEVTYYGRIDIGK
jgi:hypothetical protein